MSLKNSLSMREDTNNYQRIRVNKKKQSVPIVIEEGTKKSMDIAEAFQHQKAMAQTYREKNERNIIKCKFLYNKLTALGNLEGVPQMIASEVSEVDSKIKQLEHLLYFKKSQQMRKLKKKVIAFLEQINFEIQQEDMDKFDDQIEIILFLIDIFEQKFNEMTSERKEIDDIIARLQKQNNSQFASNSQQLQKQKQELMGKLAQLENDIERLKNEQSRRFQIKPRGQVRGEMNSQQEQILNLRNLEIERLTKKVQDIQTQLIDTKNRMRLLQNDIERAKKEDLRLKQRYKLMQIQKNQRIKLLEESLNKYV